jgi:hypothetical protein
MQYNHGALGLGAMQKGQIVKFLQIRFILCWSFRKGSVFTLTSARGSLSSAVKWCEVSSASSVLQAMNRESPSVFGRFHTVRELTAFGPFYIYIIITILIISMGLLITSRMPMRCYGFSLFL